MTLRDQWTRREFLGVVGLAAGGSLLPGCLESTATLRFSGGNPRLAARPGSPTQSAATGKSSFPIAGSSAMLYVPPTVRRDVAAPLVVFLHGALRTVEFFVDGHQESADAAGVIVLGPFASAGTWDAITRGFGPDVGIIDAALRWVFDRWTIDPGRIVFSGFSDGGTYALAVGRANGDLFSRVVAYSPGFLIDVAAVGSPPILISHGLNDNVLPIDSTSRVIVPELRQLGYAVDYREFDGPHAVPRSVLDEVVRALGPAPASRSG